VRLFAHSPKPGGWSRGTRRTGEQIKIGFEVMHAIHSGVD